MILIAGPASAISRYNSTGMTCARVHAIIRSEGAAIIRYPSQFTGNILYDRYVADSGFCVGGQAANFTTIPTADRSDCPVYNCMDVEYDQPND
jgi:hypothetical protein